MKVIISNTNIQIFIYYLYFIYIECVNVYNFYVDIYYTTDGSEPDVGAYQYSGVPIYIEGNTVIRAAGYKNGWLESPVKTSTYILGGESYDFPTIFLSTAPENFFDWYTGIYVMGPNASPDYPHFGANFWEDWERPIHFEILEVD